MPRRTTPAASDRVPRGRPQEHNTSVRPSSLTERTTPDRPESPQRGPRWRSTSYACTGASAFRRIQGKRKPWHRGRRQTRSAGSAGDVTFTEPRRSPQQGSGGTVSTPSIGGRYGSVSTGLVLPDSIREGGFPMSFSVVGRDAPCTSRMCEHPDSPPLQWRWHGSGARERPDALSRADERGVQASLGRWRPLLRACRMK
jgi:hypothetical protein